MKLTKVRDKLNKRYSAFKEHPLTQSNPYMALTRYVVFNISQTWFPKRRVYKWFDGLMFYAEKGDAGIVPNIYYKLFDYEDSRFLIDTLKEGDLFIDVGANVGHFSLLAAGICKANVIAIEPIEETFKKLTENIKLNNLEKSVNCLYCGIAEKEGTLSFLTTKSVMNRVAIGNEVDTVKVPVKTLDALLTDKWPVFIKIDVEGYEFNVLKGASKTLEKESLKYLMIEFNNSGATYGHSDADVFKLISDQGFVPIRYDGNQKKISKQISYNTSKFNTLFIRELNLEVKDA